MEPRPTCKICGKRPVVFKGRKASGGQKWGAICRTCKDKPWALKKKNVCEYCGFTPLHSCQLDVHHIDRNKSNNDDSNLMTLCANCHRLITYLERLR